MYFTLLDIIRFLSSLAVMFHHTFSFYYGKLGVYLFFIISGFVIYYSLGKGTKEYVIGRFLRLYPLFWVCCTLTYLVTLWHGNSVPFGRYLSDMLMFNDGKIASMVDGSYWTLTFELLFYLYIGIFVRIFSTKRLEWFYSIWLLITFSAFFFKFDQNIIMKLLSIRFAPYFIFGGMLALFIDRFRVSTLSGKFMHVSIMLAAIVMPFYISDSLRAQTGLISNMTGSFEGNEIYIIESFFFIILAAVYFSYFPFAQKKRFKKICHILGGITYPLYLLHWKIGETLISTYGHDYGTVTGWSVMFAIFLIAFSWMLSSYDLDFRKFLKKKYLEVN